MSEARRANPMLSRLFWPILALGLLFLFNFIFTEGFFRLEVREGRLYGSVIDILDRAAPTMLVALGMTLVISTGGIDLCVGVIMAISGAIAAGLIARPPFSVLSGINLQGSAAAALGIALLAALLAGACNGILVGILDIQPFIATLILMVAGRGIAQLLTDGQIITFQDATFAFLGNGFFLGLPFTITIVALTFLILFALVRGTALGLFIESVGNNAQASLHAGIPIRAIKLFVYVLAGGCAGMAGLIAASDIKAADANNAGLYLELDAILAVVLGGTPLIGGRFNLLGSMIGAVLIQSVTTTILTRGIPVEYTLVVKALVILILCLLQSESFRRMFAGLLRKAVP